VRSLSLSLSRCDVGIDPEAQSAKRGGEKTRMADSSEIIEEAPAPGLSMELKKDFAEKAVAAAKAVN
jgi:biotin carboxylase